MEQIPATEFIKIFENSPDLFLVLKPDFTIVAVTNAYLEATMTQREAILGRGLFEIFPDNPDEKEATGTRNLRKSLERVLKEKATDTMAVQKYDVRKPPSQGGEFEVRYWSPQNAPVLNAQQEVIYIIHKVEDVTDFVRSKEHSREQKKLNERLKTHAEQMESEVFQRAQEIQKVNEKLRVALEENDRFFSASLDMLCIAGSDGHFKKVNPAFQDVLGFTAKEMCTHPYQYFVHPDDIEKTNLEVEKQLKKGQIVLSFENRYRHKDGSYRTLSWKSVPIAGSMYAAARDITESKRKEEELKRAKDALEQANRELEAFSYSVAHDLRAPLRSTMGFSDILLEDYGPSLPADAKSLLLRVVGASKKMGLLIDGLLDLSRWSRKEPEKKNVDLSEIARSIFADLEQNQRDRRVSIRVQDGLIADGDPQLLTVALTNLISNAWKYTAKTKGEQKIEFGVVPNSTPTAYFIRDNGDGFDMKYVDKLFGTFQRLHSESQFEGIGIGLATVKRIIQRHGGTVWAESSPGEGATFFFSL